MNFGDIYDAIVEKSLRSVLEGASPSDTRKVTRDMARYIQLKDPLRKMFDLYLEVRDTRFKTKDEARYFLDEHLAVAAGLNYQDVLQYSKILATKFGIESKDVKRDTPNSKLNENISTLVKSVTFYDRYSAMSKTKAYSYIINHLTSPKPKPQSLTPTNSVFENYNGVMPVATVMNRAIRKFNSEYGKLLTETEKRAFHILQNCNEPTIKREFLKLRVEVKSKLTKHDGDIPEDLKPKLNEAFDKLKLRRKDTLQELKSKYIDVLELNTELDGIFNEKK